MSVLKSSKLLLFDGIGALVSAASLGLILPAVQPYVGFPSETLILLAFLALGLSCFSLISYGFFRESWKSCVSKVGWLNLAYCFLTVALLIYHWNNIGLLGLIYFPAEIALVVLLARWEIKVAKVY